MQELTPQPLIALNACGYTHPGRERTENEDAFSVSLDQGLFVVADGMGGRNAGAAAAHMALEELENFFRAQRAQPRSPWPFPVDRTVSFGANLLRVGIQVANQKIREAAAADPALHRMGATLAALAVGTTQLIAAHVGDVRVYRLRERTLSRLTRDHSVVEEMRAARPNMSSDQMAAIAARNVVTRALGTKDEVEPTVYVNTFAPSDLYLLCSDGLWGSVDDERISAILGGAPDLEQGCQALLDAANEAGGPDNITAVLVRIAP
jgi:serine/threonine protein phosphatase PrpC